MDQELFKEQNGALLSVHCGKISAIDGVAKELKKQHELKSVLNYIRSKFNTVSAMFYQPLPNQRLRSLKRSRSDKNAGEAVGRFVPERHAMQAGSRQPRDSARSRKTTSERNSTRCRKKEKLGRRERHQQRLTESG
ncbi:hypothetical protein J6590_036555 [Homalodisca vitripennis]|nr:hypothetical protein J6590_036555 [Homalodisca vitripennis]